MSTLQSPNDGSSATRYAVALVAWCILTAACVYQMNMMQSEWASQSRLRLAWTERLEGMVGKIRALRHDRATFYESYLLVERNEGMRRTALRDFKFDITGKLTAGPTNDDTRELLPFETFPEREIPKDIGVKIDAVIRSGLPPEMKKERVWQLLRRTLAPKDDPKAQAYPPDVKNLDEVRAVFTARWPDLSLVDWVTYSATSYLGGSHSDGPRPMARFGENVLLVGWNIDSEVRTLRDRLSITASIADAEAIVRAEWLRAAQVARELDIPELNSSAPQLILELGANEILLVSSPVIVGLALLFYIAWRREMLTQDDNAAKVYAFAFPTFQSPPDPLQEPPASNSWHRAQRLVWGLYLTVPVVLLDLAILTRFYVPKLGFMMWASVFSRVMQTRPGMHVDLWFVADVVNLLCLYGYVRLLARLAAPAGQGVPADASDPHHGISLGRRLASLAVVLGYFMYVLGNSGFLRLLYRADAWGWETLLEYGAVQVYVVAFSVLAWWTFKLGQRHGSRLLSVIGVTQMCVALLYVSAVF